MDNTERLENLVELMVKELADFPDNVNVACVSMATQTHTYIISCTKTDKRLVLGRGGNTINAIRTVLHGAATRRGIKTYVKID